MGLGITVDLNAAEKGPIGEAKEKNIVVASYYDSIRRWKAPNCHRWFRDLVARHNTALVS
jgi:hypothetical protein